MRKSRHINIAEYQSKQESSETTEEEEVKLRFVFVKNWLKSKKSVFFLNQNSSRYNRGYRRSQSVEPAVQRKGRSTTHSKRTRTSQFEYIDEESESNEVLAFNLKSI